MHLHIISNEIVLKDSSCRRQSRSANTVETACFLSTEAGSIERSGLLNQILPGTDGSADSYELFGGAKVNLTLEHAREGVRRALKSMRIS